jgi:hypothetical protein
MLSMYLFTHVCPIYWSLWHPWMSQHICFMSWRTWYRVLCVCVWVCVCVCLGMFVLSCNQRHIMIAACVSVQICSVYWRKGYYAVHVCVCSICNIRFCWLGFVELQSSSTHYDKIRRHRPSYLTRSWTFSLGACPKLWKATISFVMSVRPHGTTRFPLDGLS